MFELARFIESCRNALQSADPSSSVHRIMSNAIADQASIVGALGAGQPSSDMSAQYIFLHQSADLTILQVIAPGHFRSAPHNHLIWAVIGMYQGCEKNTFYRRDGNHLVKDGERDVTAPEVITLPSDVIHDISNPLPQPSYALHVYGGTLANPARSLWNPFTMAEERFQLASLAKYEEALNQRRGGDATYPAI